MNPPCYVCRRLDPCPPAYTSVEETGEVSRVVCIYTLADIAIMKWQIVKLLNCDLYFSEAAFIDDWALSSRHID